MYVCAGTGEKGRGKVKGVRIVGGRTPSRHTWENLQAGK